MQFQTHQGLRL